MIQNNRKEIIPFQINIWQVSIEKVPLGIFRNLGTLIWEMGVFAIQHNCSERLCVLSVSFTCTKGRPGNQLSVKVGILSQLAYPFEYGGSDIPEMIYRNQKERDIFLVAKRTDWRRCSKSRQCHRLPICFLTSDFTILQSETRSKELWLWDELAWLSKRPSLMNQKNVLSSRKRQRVIWAVSDLD